MTRDIVVAGALPRHQVRKYMAAMRPVVWWKELRGDEESTFTVSGATEAQWGQIQEWVRKVTG